jgi:hypothetical protein
LGVEIWRQKAMAVNEQIRSSPLGPHERIRSITCRIISFSKSVAFVSVVLARLLERERVMVVCESAGTWKQQQVASSGVSEPAAARFLNRQMSAVTVELIAP